MRHSNPPRPGTPERKRTHRRAAEIAEERQRTQSDLGDQTSGVSAPQGRETRRRKNLTAEPRRSQRNRRERNQISGNRSATVSAPRGGGTWRAKNPMQSSGDRRGTAENAIRTRGTDMRREWAPGTGE